MTSTSLVLHSGAHVATLDEVNAVPTPPAEDGWQPIPHAELVGSIHETLERGGLQIVKQTHGLWRDGLRYFGTLDVRAPKDLQAVSDYGLAVGIRNSHDKTFAAGLACGSRVFVCDNLAFSGEVVFARKHTTHIRADLARLVSTAIAGLTELRVKQDQRIAAYKQLQITDGTAHDVLVQSVDRKVLPITKLPDVLSEWRKPSFEDFRARTGWSLFNAFTHVMKGTAPAELARRTQLLHGLLDGFAGVVFSTN